MQLANPNVLVHLKKSGMAANTVLHNVVIIAQFFKRSGRGGIMRQLHLPERTTALPVAYTDEEPATFFVACRRLAILPTGSLDFRAVLKKD